MRKTTSVAARVLDILLLFNSLESTLSVDEISQQIALSRSTTYRYVGILCEKGVLEKSSASAYVLGPQALALARSAFAKRDLANVALPAMEHIAEATGETVLLSKISGQHTICIERVEGQHTVRVTLEIGHSQPLHAGASSRLLLAYQDNDFQEEILGGSLPRFTDNTITKPDVLRSALAKVRQQGYCISESEVDPGATAVAVPILNRRQRLLAALSTASPAFRMDDAAVQTHLMLLKEQAGRIQHQLVYTGY